MWHPDAGRRAIIVKSFARTKTNLKQQAGMLALTRDADRLVRSSGGPGQLWARVCAACCMAVAAGREQRWARGGLQD